MSGLLTGVAEDLRLRLWGLFDVPGPFLGRDFDIGTRKLRLGGSSVGLGGPGVGGLGPALPIPRASYQWLLFEDLDGTLPAGAQTFDFFGPPIGFTGAITEVDVITSTDLGNWQMFVGIDGQGSIFQISQADEVLFEPGFFKAIPAGFWPETEGLTYPLPSSGLQPLVRFRRPGGAEPNLKVRVLIVAHPAL